MTCGFAQDVYCAVQELERHRKKIRDEREEAHKIHLAELEKELSKQPHGIRRVFFHQFKKKYILFFCSPSHNRSPGKVRSTPKGARRTRSPNGS